MARQGTAKQAIDAQSVAKPANVVTQEQKDMLAKANAPVAPTGPGNVEVALSGPTTMPLNPAPINTPAPVAPRVEGQWNYGTADNQVLGEKPTVAPTQPTPTVKPATAKEAITQGFKQEINPVVAKAQPLTTEIGREAKLGQLPTVQQAQNQAEQDRINTSNLKSQSGQQLWSNLETISGANSSLLNDRNAFNKAFGYDGKDVSEKALVDAFWKSKRLDANSIYGAISTGATIPNESKNTPAFTDALIRHQDTTRFENLNPYQLSKVINSELIPGTQTYNDLMAKNPQLVTDAMKLASINTPVTARQETSNWQDNLSNYLARSPVMSNPTTVATIMNSDPNIATKTNEVQAVEDKLTEAKDRLKNVQKSVTERYKGTGATKQTVNAKALAESQDIIDEITMLEANKASASSALTTLIQNAKDNYTYARQDREDALAQYNKGFEQLTAMAKMGMDQDNEQYKRQQDATTRDLQLLMHYDEQDQANAREQRGYDFQMKRDEQNFGQQKELAKMGYNQAERMSSINYNQDINKLRLTNDLQTNKDLQTRVMDMRQQGYSDQYIQNTIYGGGMSIDRQTAISQYGSTPAVRNFNPGNIMDTGFGGQKVEGERFTRFNTPQEGFNALVSKIQNIQAGNSKVYSPNMSLLQYISKYAPASDNNNPVAYANGIAKNLGISPNTQLKDIDPNKLAMEHARHEDGNMYKMLQDMGINSKQSISQPTQTTSPKEVSANAKSWVDSWDKGTMDLETILTKIGSSKEAAPLKNEVMQYVASRGGVAYRPPTDSNVVQLQKKIDELDELIANDEHMEDVSGMLQMSPWDTLTSKKQDYLSRVDNLLQGNVLQKLIDAKAAGATFGALSDAELKMLQSTSSALMGRALKDNDKVTGFDISTPEMKRQLQLLRDGYAASIDKMTGRVSLSEKSNATPVDNRFSELYSQLK